jgi:glycosyltransferase involved in cell wall biosynthesis
MKILILYEYDGFDFKNRFSAVASVLTSMADLLSKQGHEVFLNDYGLYDYGEPTTESYNFGYSKFFFYRKFARLFPSYFRQIFKDLKLFVGQYKLFLRLGHIDKPDIIISWTVYGGRYGVKLSEKWNIPLVSVFDNPISDEYLFLMGFSPFFRKWIDLNEKKCIQNADAVIVYSPQVKEYLQKKYRCNSDFFVKAFHDFTRSGNFTKSVGLKSTFKILYIGSFFNWHNVDVLINAFVSISKIMSGLELVLVGSGPEHARIVKLVNSLDCVNPINLPGLLDDSKLSQIISTANVGVIPGARWYQAPMKLYQYASHGLAVVSINTPTISYITQGNCGFKLFNNIDELELILLNLCQDTQALQRASDSAFEFYNAEMCELNYVNFFNQLLDDVNQF